MAFSAKDMIENIPHDENHVRCTVELIILSRGSFGRRQS